MMKGDESKIDLRLQDPDINLELEFVFAMIKFTMPNMELGVSPTVPTHN